MQLLGSVLCSRLLGLVSFPCPGKSTFPWMSKDPVSSGKWDAEISGYCCKMICFFPQFCQCFFLSLFFLPYFILGLQNVPTLATFSTVFAAAVAQAAAIVGPAEEAPTADTDTGARLPWAHCGCAARTEENCSQDTARGRRIYWDEF